MSLTAPGPNPSGQCAFIQKMYSTITAHTRSFQAFFCTRATSFLPLTTGRNVGLTATMQQRPSALYHILSSPVNSTPTRRFSFLRAFSPVNPKTGTPLGVPVFRILLSILRPAVSYHRISRSDIVLAAMMTIQQTSGAAHSNHRQNSGRNSPSGNR